jgi:hypothetical protein
LSLEVPCPLVNVESDLFVNLGGELIGRFPHRLGDVSPNALEEFVDYVASPVAG